MIKLKKEPINSLLLILFLFLPTLTLPLKEFLQSGASVWITTILILIISFYVNKLRITYKLFYILFILILLILVNLILVDYKEIIINDVIEFIKFGLIGIYLATQVTNYELTLKYWYYAGLINFCILFVYIDLVTNHEMSYMSFGTHLSYSFIIFSVYFYKQRKINYKIINLLLMILTFFLILSFGNRSSILACILVIIIFELRTAYRNILYSIVKLTLILVPILFLVYNIYNIVWDLNNYVRSLGYNSYALDKIILMLDEGLAESASGRDVIYDAAIQVLKESYLLPRGLGYFQNMTGMNYPHNVFLDILIVFGIFSIPLILFLAYFLVKNYFNSDNEAYKLLLISLTIFILTRLLFSGTFISETALWIIIGLLISYETSSHERGRNINELIHLKI